MRVQRYQEPDVRSGFDFTGLPLGQTARVLATVGSRALEKALGSPDPVDLSPLIDLTDPKFLSREAAPLSLGPVHFPPWMA